MTEADHQNGSGSTKADNIATEPSKILGLLRNSLPFIKDLLSIISSILSIFHTMPPMWIPAIFGSLFGGSLFYILLLSPWEVVSYFDHRPPIVAQPVAPTAPADKCIDLKAKASEDPACRPGSNYDLQKQGIDASTKQGQ